MKNQKLGLFVIVLVFASLACNALVPNSPNNVDNAPAVDFITPAEPLNVTIQLDEDDTISGMFSPNGSTMSLTTKDGTVFTLDVPPNALEVDTALTMTAVKSITGAPLDDGAVFAVQLEPSGLFFNELVTLTILLAKEIPIENQIIFGYEGSGQDYHLAIVDPKSREIKIKLLEFSGAGVGSGGDIEWAANLQNQASSTSARLWQKFGEISQKERMGRILGEIPDDTDTGWAKSLENTLNQFEDQVVLKESVAAELDCQYAGKALEDLISLERMRQLFPVNDDPIKTKDFAAKVAKLVKIGEKCNKKYSASGTWGVASLTGIIDSQNNPFTLAATAGGDGSCDGEVVFSGGSTGGVVSCSMTCGGLNFVGDGSYTIAITEDGGTISGDCSSYLPASGGYDIPDIEPINVTLQRVP